MRRPESYDIHPGISQSDMKLFEQDIVDFYQQKILGEVPEEVKADHFEIGNLIDAILLDQDALKNFYVMADMKATGKVREVVDFIVTMLRAEDPPALPNSLSAVPDRIEKAVVAVDYQKNWGMQTRVTKIMELGKGYYEQLLEAGDKSIVSMDNWNAAHTTVNSIQEDEFTGPILTLLREGGKDVEVCKQTALYGEFEGEPLKGLLDFYFVFESTKVIQPWDLKSCRNHAGFMSNYRLMRYGRQGSFYSELLRQNYPEYTIEPFRFLAIPTKSKEHVERYRMSESELYANAEGAETESGYHIKGWKEIIREIQWHRNAGDWSHRKEYFINGGENLIKGNADVDPALLVEENVIHF